MKKQITIAADLAMLKQIGDEIAAMLADTPDLAENVYGIQLAVHECLTNIVVHAYGDVKEDIHITLTLDDKQFSVVLQDRGRQFSIEDIKHPDLENGQIHGYGIFLMHELLDDVTYSPQPGVNQWYLAKKRTPQAAAKMEAPTGLSRKLWKLK